MVMKPKMKLIERNQERNYLFLELFSESEASEI